MQSSSATIAIVLTALNLHLLSFNSASAMVIGANVGTTATILLGAIGAVQVKKRVAFSHLVFNLGTAVVALILMPVLVYVVSRLVNIETDAVIGLALFHTIFNILGVLLFLPFIAVLARLLIRVFPDKKTEVTIYINNTTTDVPEAAISALKKETLHLVHDVLRYNLNLMNIDRKLVFSDYDYSHSAKKESDVSLEDMYDNLKLLQARIFGFSVTIQSNALTDTESGELTRYLHAARMALHSAKSLKDVKHNFDEFGNADSNFLNDQNAHFRKRLIETYLKIDRIIAENGKKNKTKAILSILNQLTSDDKYFIVLVSQAIDSKQIKDLELSSIIIANRAFVQSSRQVLLAIRELVLNDEEIEQFDVVQDISDTLEELDG
jgi:phosphate:Na+ symporter